MDKAFINRSDLLDAKVNECILLMNQQTSKQEALPVSNEVEKNFKLVFDKQDLLVSFRPL